MKSLKIKLLFFGLVSLMFFGCAKDDVDPPTITLIGDNPLNHEMRKPYVDPGATASDEEDGDISSAVIIDDSEVDIDLPQTYSVFFSVSDVAGNVGTATRSVKVFATPQALADTYNVIDTVSLASANTILNYPQTITVDPLIPSSRIRFNKFGNWSNATIYAEVDPSGVIDIPSQTLPVGGNSINHTFSGSGIVTKTGIYINYSDASGGNTANCKAYYTR